MPALRSDPITKYFDGVPADKRAMTLEHLMTMQSGFPDFFHIAGVDDDYDVSWIDRNTAVERILALPLLFPPGEGREHSHTAWGLLAAVIEIVSGESYEGFLDQHFLGPAGMTRTGPYGDDIGFPRESFAAGYGGAQASDPNIPPNWGKTSWLIKGSGGMVSTPGDMQRWYETLRAGKILQGEALARHIGPGVSMGGTERGFVFLRPDDGEGTVVFLASNVGGQSPLVQSVTRRLIRLVMGDVEMQRG